MDARALKRPFGVGLMLALFAGPWTPGQAGIIYDFSGQWDMTADLFAPDEAVACSYAGTAQVVHNIKKGTFSGIAVLELTQGPGVCPAEMAGEISGDILQPPPPGQITLNGVIFGGVWGEAAFTGGLVLGKGDALPVVLGGTLDVLVGPFAGGDTGGWGGMVSDGVFKDSFETLIVVSAGSSLLLLLGAGMLIHRRRV